MLPQNLAPLRRKLLNWYDKNCRDLPWRRGGDPYAIWISETMLQQTQVATVLSYYEKFMREFPTIEALDRAPLERVLRVWSGLGYYRRAENLKKAARQISSNHGGKLPNQFAALRQLPGIGEYTAGAILSIAFTQRYAAVDGNVRRVLSRVLDITDERKLRLAASTFVPRSRPGDFNQALMELGAMLCAPREPICRACPLSAHCAARRQQGQAVRRQQPQPLKFKAVTWPLAIVRRGGKILLRRRGVDGLLARLWELPGGENHRRSSPPAFLRSQLQPLNCPIRRLQRVGEIRHSITYRRIRAPIYLIDCPAGVKLRLPNKYWRWVEPRALANLPISSMTAKAIKSLLP